MNYHFVQELGVSLKHIESRPSRSDPAAKCDYFMDCSFPKLSSEKHQQMLDQLITQLKETSSCITVPSGPKSEPESPCSKDGKKETAVPWFPRSIAELDRCCTNLHKYGHEMAPDHPVSNLVLSLPTTIGTSVTVNYLATLRAIIYYKPYSTRQHTIN